MIIKIKAELVRSILIQWIIYMHIALSIIKNEYFETFLRSMSPTFELVIPKVGNIICNWVLDIFIIKKQYIHKNLRINKSQINLTFDLWTSPNSMTLLSIVGH